MDEFIKVSVGKAGMMHVASSYNSHDVTLCGRKWWAENNHGELYCQICQHVLALKFKTRRADEARNRKKNIWLC